MTVVLILELTGLPASQPRLNQLKYRENRGRSGLRGEIIVCYGVVCGDKARIEEMERILI